MFQGISSRSLRSRMPKTKKATVETRMMAVLSTAARAGRKERKARSRIMAPTIRLAVSSRRESGPSAALSWRALSLSPGMLWRSGRQKIIKKAQMAKTMIQPTGAR